MYDHDVMSKWIHNTCTLVWVHTNCVYPVVVYTQVSTIAKECVKSVLSQHEKFNKAHMMAQDLATLAAEVGMAEFKERLSFLKQVREVWRTGGSATLQVLEEEKSTK